MLLMRPKSGKCERAGAINSDFAFWPCVPHNRPDADTTAVTEVRVNVV